MIVFGYILLCLGIIIYLFGAVRFLAIAYRHNIWWFLGCFFIPIVSLIFFLLNIRATAKPFCFQICGILLMGIGGMLAKIT
jgi:hypothetical protein